MRKLFSLQILLGIYLLISVQGISLAQMPQWTVVEIPGDSLSPTYLTFFDSLHGYLGAVKAFRSQTDNIIVRHLLFETTDGGRNWKEITDTIAIHNLTPGFSDFGGYFNPPVIYGTLSSRWILHAHGPNEDNLWPPYIEGRIAHTDDGERSWYFPLPLEDPDTRRNFYPLHSFSPGEVLVYDRDSGMLFESTINGRSYQRIIDSTYYYSINRIQLDSHYYGYGQYHNDWGSQLSFDASDRMHWTVALGRGGYFQALVPPTRPMGLQALTSSDNGHSWKLSITPIPGEDTQRRIGGTLQYIKGTPNLYYFTGWAAEGLREPGLYLPNIDYGDPMCGINWLYSTDYGATWEFHREYADTRRGFEAVRQNEVWITARSKNSAHSYSSAYIIARTKDNGKTWEEDSTTLNGKYDQTFDGRMIAFSDPSHGWIAAITGALLSGNQISNYHTWIFRYNANEQPKNEVEENISMEVTRMLLKVYPNPSTEQVYLQLMNPRVIKGIDFYDMLGRRQFPPYKYENNLAIVDVNNLPSGAYIARLSYYYQSIPASVTLPFVVHH